MSLTTISRPIPAIDADLTDWDFNQDPFHTIEEWRSLGPVVHNAHDGMYLVFSYRDCARVLGNTSQFNSAISARQFARTFGGITMEGLDSERHHAMRGVWGKDFERNSLATHQETIRSVVDARLDPFVERLRSGETVDAVAGLTRGVPTLVIAHLLGIEPEMYQQLSDWSDAMGGASESLLDQTARSGELIDSSAAATAALNDFIRGVIAEKRVNGDDGGLLAKMIFHDYAQSMDEQEIVASNTQLVFAGNETTAKLMASTLVALAQYPTSAASWSRTAP
jgi:cytochrome P450